MFLTICFTLWPHRHLSQQMRGRTWLENFLKKFCHQKKPSCHCTCNQTDTTREVSKEEQPCQIPLKEDSSIFLMDLP